ncbi:MAG: hypothetical protein OXJ90_01560 [Spirochaetaceae bacterium]|nr:hypothetical protein [Spirochaetaceae bacterium]
MDAVTSPTIWSTVAALPDYLLLAQTRQLARHEQALQILVLDHLREIEARRLHLTRGYGSLFDYVVHELGYTAAAAWRRIKAMRLCTQTDAARELLRAHHFGGEALLEGRARQRFACGGTEQRRARCFASDAPWAGRTRWHVARGAAGRAGRFGGEAAYEC